MRPEYLLWLAIACLWVAEDRIAAERRRRADKERTLLRQVDELDEQVGRLEEQLAAFTSAKAPARPAEPVQ